MLGPNLIVVLSGLVGSEAALDGDRSRPLPPIGSPARPHPGVLLDHHGCIRPAQQPDKTVHRTIVCCGCAPNQKVLDSNPNGSSEPEGIPEQHALRF